MTRSCCTVSLAALLGLGMAAGASASPTSASASLTFSQITFTVGDMDPSDSIAPGLTVLGPGQYANTAGGSLYWFDRVSYESEKLQASAPALPAGSMFDIGPMAMGTPTKGASLLSANDIDGARIQLNAMVSGSHYGEAAYLIAGFELSPGSPAAGAPYSFTLGAGSFATLSMQVDASVSLTGADVQDTFENANLMWVVSLTGEAATGLPAQAFTGGGSLNMASGLGPSEQSASKLAQYTVYNPTSAPINGSLTLFGVVGANSEPHPFDPGFYPPGPAVPEPEAVMLLLAGLGTLGAIRVGSRRRVPRAA